MKNYVKPEVYTEQIKLDALCAECCTVINDEDPDYLGTNPPCLCDCTQLQPS
ncbi:MAG: hypothetical protein GF410_06650 [Chitinivibrionales bacterium]|nr:hypothetical protein [Chitinivibrionales bacterium]